MWKKIRTVSEDEVSVLDRFLRGKARFLVDENIGKLTELLRDLGWNAVSVQELGIAGHPDEEIFGVGWREKRVIITNDRDFLDDRKFPFHRCPGIVVVPSPSEGMNFFADALANILPVLKHYAHAFDGTKIIVNADGTSIIRGFSKERGLHWKLQIKFDGHGSVLENTVEKNASKSRLG